MKYVVITKPGIAAGVLAAGAAGMALAARGVPDPTTAAYCLFCILAAASGSAIMNVVLERRTDALMPRVKGRLESLDAVGAANAAVLSSMLVAAAVVISFIRLNAVCSLLILAAALGYTVLYTLYLKRRSPYGTVAGGIPGALPVLIGYSAVKPGIGPDGLVLFLVMLLWQPPHFLALALKYKDEYAAAGLPVMPVALGEGYSSLFAFAYASALLPLTLSLYLLGYCSAFYGWSALLLGLFFLGAYFIDMAGGNYGRAFLSSIVYIMGVLAAAAFDAAALH